MNFQVVWIDEEILYLSEEQRDICQMKANGKNIKDIYEASC